MVFIAFFFLVVLRIEAGALCVLGKCFIFELYPQFVTVLSV